MGKSCRDMAEALRACMEVEECMQSDRTRTLKTCLRLKEFNHECKVRFSSWAASQPVDQPNAQISAFAYVGLPSGVFRVQARPTGHAYAHPWAQGRHDRQGPGTARLIYALLEPAVTMDSKGGNSSWALLKTDMNQSL